VAALALLISGAAGETAALAQARVLSLLVVVVLGVPVTGFTIMLVNLVRRGIETAETVDEVRALIEACAAAFFLPLTLRRGAPRQPAASMTGQVTAAQDVGADAIEDRPRRQALTGEKTETSATARPGEGRRPRKSPLNLVPHHTFWNALTREEQDALTELMSLETFPKGSVLFRKNQPADRVLVIREGLTKVTRGDGDDEEIALRGPGDIIGERAIFLVRQRSATVTALTEVRALVAPAAAFNAFLQRHPRVVAVLEHQVYDRLTHVPGGPTWRRPIGPSPPEPSWSGQTCSIVFADVVGFSDPRRTDEDRLEVRRALYAILAEAFDRSGISWAACHREDRGDGALIVVPPHVAPRLLIDPLPDRLRVGLRRHNRAAGAALTIRLRVACDIGPVTSDPHGVSGSCIIRAARLLDAPAFKKRMAASPTADLGLIVSSYVYDSVIRHMRGRSGPDGYERVGVEVKETRLNAWATLR